MPDVKVGEGKRTVFHMAIAAIVLVSVSYSATALALIIISDAVGDNGGYPAYTDIEAGLYDFNATHVMFGMRVNGTIPSTYANGTLFYGFLIDTDADSATGYYYSGIGADYLTEMRIDSNGRTVFEIYVYAGDGTTWVWNDTGYYVVPSFKGVDIADDTVFANISKTYLNLTSSSSIEYAGYVTINTTTVDDVVESTPLPIPEPFTIVAAVAVGAAASLIRRFK